ncbi:MAG: hypothetical protein AAGC86_04630 [Pseudomonadota bacterium]
MDILQGALAFAVAMIVFSTVVTGIVEVILRALRIRPLLLIQAMEHYVEQYLQREMQRRGLTYLDDEKWKDLKSHIVGALVGNPAKTAVPSIDATGEVANNTTIGRFSAVEDLSTYAFLQRLAKTEAGQELVAKYHEIQTGAHDELHAFLQDALRTFERFMATVNERFRIRSQRYAMLVALVFAVGFNVSAGRLFTQLTTDTPLQQELIVQAEAYAEENRQRAAALRAQFAAAEEEAAQQPTGETPDAQETSPSDADATGQDPVEAQTLEDLLERADALQKRSEELLLESGLPLGPTYFPYNRSCADWRQMITPEATGDNWVTQTCAALGRFTGDEGSESSDAQNTAGMDTTEPTRGNLLMWMINVVIAGFLIGLGGPFWYRVYSSLSNVAQIVRMLRGGNGRPEVLTEDSEKLPATKAGIKEATDGAGRRGDGDLVSVFLTAAGPARKRPPADKTTAGAEQDASDPDTSAEPA